MDNYIKSLEDSNEELQKRLAEAEAEIEKCHKKRFPKIIFKCKGPSRLDFMAEIVLEPVLNGYLVTKNRFGKDGHELVLSNNDIDHLLQGDLTCLQ